MHSTTSDQQRTRRVRRRHSAIVRCIVVAAVAVAIFGTQPAHAATVDSTERAMLQKINSYRAARGLPRLRMDRRLTDAAHWMSRDMVRHNRFSHTDSLGRNPFQRIAAFRYPSARTTRGENLAAGYSAPRLTLLQWKRSRSHNANLLNRRYRAIGIARVRGGRYGWYWTTTYGSRVVSLQR